MRRTALRLLALAMAGVTLAPAAGADEEPPAPADRPDKSGYWLFNPTPDHLLRALDPSSATETESPYTVDAGRFQYEAGLLEYARNEQENTKIDITQIFVSTVRLGLTHWMSLEVGFTPYSWQAEHRGGEPNETLQGFRDLSIGAKVNLWGNDPGDGPATAAGVLLAIIPPTGGDLGAEEVGGLVSLPFIWTPYPAVSLGGMAQFEFDYNPLRGGHETDFTHSVQLSYQVLQLEPYVEYVGKVFVDGEEGYRPRLNGGLIGYLGDNFSVDVGFTGGLNDNAIVWGGSFGFTLRF